MRVLDCKEGDVEFVKRNKYIRKVEENVEIVKEELEELIY